MTRPGAEATAAGNYTIEEIEEGERIKDVLAAVSYSRRDLVSSVRKAAEEAVRLGTLSIEESARLIRQYEKSMGAYTYLGEDQF